MDIVTILLSVGGIAAIITAITMIYFILKWIKEGEEDDDL